MKKGIIALHAAEIPYFMLLILAGSRFLQRGRQSGYRIRAVPVQPIYCGIELAFSNVLFSFLLSGRHGHCWFPLFIFL
ncbi:hypothetical protein [Paenibacillus sp. SI8]|uniref:hypothetical protein n=1 Tax=unclassified Paenibacillus TaxID=185978 RepID=UPI003466AAAA